MREVEVDEDADQIVGRVDGEDVGLLIGRRGQTIDAVQLLCYRAAFRGLQDRKRVVGGRRRLPGTPPARRSSGRPIAPPSGRSKAGKEIELEPMTATERRVVHQHLKDRAGLETFSEGDDPERCVIVAPLLSD